MNEDKIIIKRSKEAKDYYNNFIGNPYKKESDIYNFCQSGDFEENAAISSRWRENALRLATAITAYDIQIADNSSGDPLVSAYTIAPFVTKQVLEWSYNFVKTVNLEFYKTFQEEASQTEYQKNKKAAIKWFKERYEEEPKDYMLTDLTRNARPFKNIKPSERRVLLEDLVQSGIIYQIPISQTNKKFKYRYKDK